MNKLQIQKFMTSPSRLFCILLGSSASSAWYIVSVIQIFHGKQQNLNKQMANILTKYLNNNLTYFHCPLYLINMYKLKKLQ